MSTTDRLTSLQGHVNQDVPTSGHAARIWAADVLTVNPDGTVDCQPVQSRATKFGVPVPVGYSPTVGDRVLVCDLNGDPRLPAVLSALSSSVTPVLSSDTRNLQPGDLVPSRASSRAGCLLCDGTTYLAADYPKLAAACPDLVSGLNLTVPDYRGRDLIGAGTGSGLSARTLGQTGGEEQHQLSIAEMPAHTHTVPAFINSTAFSTGFITRGNNVGSENDITSGSTGGGGAHNNMQPYAVVNWFIKT